MASYAAQSRSTQSVHTYRARHVNKQCAGVADDRSVANLKLSLERTTSCKSFAIHFVTP